MTNCCSGNCEPTCCFCRHYSAYYKNSAPYKGSGLCLLKYLQVSAANHCEDMFECLNS